MTTAPRGVPAPFYRPDLTADLMRAAPDATDHLRLMPLADARALRPAPLTLLLEDPALLSAQLRLRPGWAAVEGGVPGEGHLPTWPVLTRLWTAWVAALPVPPDVTFTGPAAEAVRPALTPAQVIGETLERRAAVIMRAVRAARELRDLPAERGEARGARAALTQVGQAYPTQGRAGYESLWTYTDGTLSVQVNAAQETVTWTDGRTRQQVRGLAYHLTFPGGCEALDLRGAAAAQVPGVPDGWVTLRLRGGEVVTFAGPDEPALLLRDGAPVRVIAAPGRWTLP